MRAAFLLPVLLLAGCMSYSEVKLEGVQAVQVKRLDATGLSASVTLLVENPNAYRIAVMDPDVDLYVNGMAIGKAALDSTLTLEPRVRKAYTVPLHASFTNGAPALLPALLGSAFTGSLKLGAKGTVVGKAWLVRKRFPFAFEHQLEWGR